MRNLILLFIVVLSLCSCKTKERIVEIPITHTEYKYVDKIKYDSIYFKDSVFMFNKGDTIYLNKYIYRYKYKYLKDTVTVNKTDTITKLQKIETIKTVNKLNTIQKILIYIGLFSIVILIFILYKHIKK